MYRIGTNNTNASGRLDYYPFGSVMQGRVYSSGEQRSGYQGSEKLFDVNSYLTYFRPLESRIGRWLSVDPYLQASQSPYSSMNCNPIHNNDVMGNIIGDGKDKVESYKHALSKMESRLIKSNFKLLSKIDKRRETLIDRGKSADEISKDKKMGRLQREVEFNKSDLASINEIRNEIKTLEQSTWVYDIVDNNADGSLVGGRVYHSKTDNHIKVVLKPNIDFLEAISHELKHAYQFEKGKLSFQGSGSPFWHYDAQDELESFRRSQFMGYYKNDDIDLNWLENQGYDLSLLSRKQRVVGVSYEDMCMYYFTEGAKGTKLDQLMIYNLPNWADIYLNGYNSTIH